MLDQTALRTELANHYDLAPSAELAAAHAGIYSKMERVISPPDWAIFAPYVVAINALKKQRNAVILAHNYMTPEIFHGIAEVVALAEKALQHENSWDGFVWFIDPVVSSTIITSVFEKLSFASHCTATGTLVSPKTRMIVVGTLAEALPEIE